EAPLDPFALAVDRGDVAGGHLFLENGIRDPERRFRRLREEQAEQQEIERQQQQEPGPGIERRHARRLVRLARRPWPAHPRTGRRRLRAALGLSSHAFLSRFSSSIPSRHGGAPATRPIISLPFARSTSGMDERRRELASSERRATRRFSPAELEAKLARRAERPARRSGAYAWRVGRRPWRNDVTA